jgi:Lon protease-like protein
MLKLPLFPLRTVLFPGMPLALHIFEDRYKEMMRNCIECSGPFGVVLIKHGDEIDPAAEPYAIGCTARVVQVEPLPEGRMNLVAMGGERFRVERLLHDQTYLCGDAKLLPLADGDLRHAQSCATTLRPLLTDYLGILAEATGSDFDLDRLPLDPAELAHTAAYLLQAPAEQKQHLLASDSVEDLLVRLNALYREEVPLFRAMLAGGGPPHFGSFSLS